MSTLQVDVIKNKSGTITVPVAALNLDKGPNQ